MNQVYQFHAEAVNVTEGLLWQGVYATAEERNTQLAKMQAQGYSVRANGSRMGVSPWGEWFSHYDHQAYLDAVGEWAGDHKFTGRD